MDEKKRQEIALKRFALISPAGKSGSQHFSGHSLSDTN